MSDAWKAGDIVRLGNGLLYRITSMTGNEIRMTLLISRSNRKFHIDVLTTATEPNESAG